MVQATNDLPYYNGQPAEISGTGWLLILVSVLAAFGFLIALPLPAPPLNFIPAILFTGLPLLTLMAVSRWQPPAIFRRLDWREFGLAIGFGVATAIVSLVAGLVVSAALGANGNPAVEALSAMTGPGFALFLARTFIQLIGEEVVTILPLLAVLWFCVRRLGLSRRVGIVIGVVLSTLWFSAMHLPTYGWNVWQCLGIIGTARIVLTLSFLLTRNLWVSSIAHIVNDWSEFGFVFGLSHFVGGVSPA